MNRKSRLYKEFRKINYSWGRSKYVLQITFEESKYK